MKNLPTSCMEREKREEIFRDRRAAREVLKRKGARKGEKERFLRHSKEGGIFLRFGGDGQKGDGKEREKKSFFKKVSLKSRKRGDVYQLRSQGRKRKGRSRRWRLHAGRAFALRSSKGGASKVQGGEAAFLPKERKEKSLTRLARRKNRGSGIA